MYIRDCKECVKLRKFYLLLLLGVISWQKPSSFDFSGQTVQCSSRNINVMPELTSKGTVIPAQAVEALKLARG
jgi:hypothetical protein